MWAEPVTFGTSRNSKYDHFNKIFDNLESRKQEAGISTIVVTREAENSNKMHCIMEIPSIGSDQRIYDATCESRLYEKMQG